MVNKEVQPEPESNGDPETPTEYQEKSQWCQHSSFIMMTPPILFCFENVIPILYNQFVL
jgi:hypothetical protein